MMINQNNNPLFIQYEYPQGSEPDLCERLSNLCLFPLRASFGYRICQLGTFTISQKAHSIAVAILSAILILTTLPLTIIGIILNKFSKTEKASYKNLLLHRVAYQEPRVLPRIEQPQPIIAPPVQPTQTQTPIPILIQTPSMTSFPPQINDEVVLPPTNPLSRQTTHTNESGDDDDDWSSVLGGSAFLVEPTPSNDGNNH